MKLKEIVLIFCLVLCEVIAADNSSAASTDTLKRKSSLLCPNATCLMKCCSLDKIIMVKERNGFFRRRCGVYSGEIPRPSSFNRGLENFTVIAGIYEFNKTFKSQAIGTSKLTDFNVYLSQEAKVYLEMPNAYHRWIIMTNDMFCYDFEMRVNSTNTTIQPAIFVTFADVEDEPSRTSSTLLTTAMLITSFFLFLVLVVYGLLKELRNLCGKILMAYVGSTLGAFLLLAVIRMKQHSIPTCLGLTFCIYFFFLSSFCWMSVMSYDIWWTFRGYAKARPIHRRGETFKFLMYSLYAYGLPLFMTIALAVLNESDLRHVPWFITPKIPQLGCFLDGEEKLLYLYLPMLILILCNWIFYLMTAFNIWRLSRGTAVLDSAAAGTPQAHRTHRHRFLVYLKLSVVMGLNWVLEVVSYVFPGYKVWYITDSYNILVGVAIFLIFVCKWKIIRKLMKLFMGYKKSRWYPGHERSTRSTTSASDSSASQETQTLQVCSNPKGPGYTMKNLPNA